MTGKERSGNAQRESDENLPERAAQHHGHDALPRCAQRHADADLAGATGHKIAHHTVKSHRGKNQRQRAEDAGQPRNQTL